MKMRQPAPRRGQWRLPWSLLLLSALLAGCGPHVVMVDPLREFPHPVVSSYPADIALYYPEEFRQFTHIEERPGARGGDWEISLGPPQVQVFDVVFRSLFRSATHIDADHVPQDVAASAIFVPYVEDFQFALPVDTNIKIFEIWVKYSLAVLDRDGNEVMRWPFTAYGKTPTAFLTSDSAAVNAAALIALRDAGASLISGFERDTKLKAWLSAQAQSAAPQAVSAVEVSEAPSAEAEATEEDG